MERGNVGGDGLRVLVVGGDGRLNGLDGAVLRCASRREGGVGGLRCAKAMLRSGRVGSVFLLVRWLSHAESDTLAALCRRKGIPLVMVPGGISMLRSLLRVAVCP
jgi:hypothetical protein